ncbi:hypothetical protein [Ruegeria sp. HKCCD8929]|uniref:hypothetical protein n=1 Tax=Ruegeria sp. HKCCD8929 TaxID=2683006 RepID=UPI001488E6CB|nr:hypothetical protein [Ruegeria sp. HKCCD8929]
MRKELKDEGQIEDQDIRIEGLTNSQFTEAQLVDARSYEVGQRVLSLVNSRNHGLEKHAVYYVTKVDPERNRITVADERDDSKRILPLAATFNRRELGRSLVAYEPEERKLAAGDAIRFRITDKEAGIANGLRATIATTGGGTIEATTQDGKTFSVAQDSLVARGIEHDYATTAHGVQGASVPHPILVMLSSEQLVNQKSFYVEISRGVESATLITDDAKELKESVEERTGVRMTALEAWLESQRADDRDDRRAHQVNDRDREQAAEKDQGKDPDKDPQKDRENHKQAQLELPGFVKEKLEEMEKQVELIRERSRELER